MGTQKTDRKVQTRPLGIAALVALIVGAIFLTPFFGVIVTSVILAFSFSPINRWFTKRTKRPHSAPLLTLLTAFFMVVIPLVLILGVTVAQTRTLAGELQETVNELTVGRDTEELVLQVNQTLYTVTGGLVDVSKEEIISFASTAGAEIANGLIRIITNVIGSIPAMLTAVVLFIYIFLAVLTYQKQIMRFIKRLNPLGDDVYDLYVSRTAAMTNGMVRGQFLIALVQGIVGTATFAIAGVPYLAFFFLLLTFLSIIPLGSGIVSLPVGIILLATGNIWQGLVVLLGHLLIVGNIDNILRPILIPKAARLPSALTLIGVFAGLAMFGFLGIIIGPVLIILILTTLEVYIANKEMTEKPAKAVTK